MKKLCPADLKKFLEESGRRLSLGLLNGLLMAVRKCGSE